MGRLSMETKANVIRLKNEGICVQQILKHLQYEGVNISSISQYAPIKTNETSRTIRDLK